LKFAMSSSGGFCELFLQYRKAGSQQQCDDLGAMRRAKKRSTMDGVGTYRLRNMVEELLAIPRVRPCGEA
jgi:hypothetical protein